MTDATNRPMDVRTSPVQKRSMERIDLLLDTAAKIIDSEGINGLTTGKVATLSGSSVGVVYRYFPNIESLLLALAERNLKQFRIVLGNRLATGDIKAWPDLVAAAVHTYAELARDLAGFRVIRFGDVIAFRFPDAGTDVNDQLAEGFEDLFVNSFGFSRSVELRSELEVVMEVADALTRRAFVHDREGETKFLTRTIDLITDLLRPFAPADAPQ